MNQTVKSCPKNFKNAEMKLFKIMNKIDSLKLSNSYVLLLEIHKNGKSVCLKGKSLRYFLFSVVIVCVLAFSARWIYNEFSGRPVSMFQSLFS